MGLVADMKTLMPAGHTVTLGDMPDLPDNLIALYDAPGRPSQHSFTRVEHEEPTLQVRVRNTSYPAAITLCEQIKDLLDGQTELTINGRRYLSIMLSGEILPLGRDSKNRAMLSLNFNVRVKR